MPAPRKKSAASFELPSSTATRSPGLSPSPIRPLANLQPRSQVCAKVSRSLPWTTASRSAKNAAARRIAVVTSMASSGHLTASQTNPQGPQRYPLLGPDLHRLDRTSLRLAHLFDHLVRG